MKALDRNRPFGEVFGAGHARYEQDHTLFDAQGQALTAPELKAAPKSPAAAQAEPAKRGRKAKEPAPAPQSATQTAPAAVATDPAPAVAEDAQLAAQLAG